MSLDAPAPANIARRCPRPNKTACLASARDICAPRPVSVLPPPPLALVFVTVVRRLRSHTLSPAAHPPSAISSLSLSLPFPVFTARTCAPLLPLPDLLARFRPHPCRDWSDALLPSPSTRTHPETPPLLGSPLNPPPSAIHQIPRLPATA